MFFRRDAEALKQCFQRSLRGESFITVTDLLSNGRELPSLQTEEREEPPPHPAMFSTPTSSIALLMTLRFTMHAGILSEATRDAEHN